MFDFLCSEGCLTFDCSLPHLSLCPVSPLALVKRAERSISTLKRLPLPFVACAMCSPSAEDVSPVVPRHFPQVLDPHGVYGTNRIGPKPLSANDNAMTKLEGGA